jgi:hypothetical protein
MEDKSKNIPLMVALSIPVLMVMLVAVSIYLPVLFVDPPRTDFVYSVGWNYYSQYQYVVREGKVVENKMERPESSYTSPNSPQPKIFYYDVDQEVAREITLQEAQEWTVDEQEVSADGFRVVQGSHGGDILFFSYDSRCKQYLQKGAFSRQLNLNSGGDYCYSFRFLGWVKGE